MLVNVCTGKGANRCICCVQGEITDVKINADATRMASSSVDGTIRIWSLEKMELGYPLAVLTPRPDRVSEAGSIGISAQNAAAPLGIPPSHAEAANAVISPNSTQNIPGGVDLNSVTDQANSNDLMINFLDWNPLVPNALASVSSDGICRIWDTETGADPIELRPASSFGRPPFVPPRPARAPSIRANGSASLDRAAPETPIHPGPATGAAPGAPSPGVSIHCPKLILISMFP